jgi:hypothetical protein
MKKLIRRIRYGAPVVVVSGLPRSGTSMAMQMLTAGGYPVITDGVRAADEDNPKGYYEEESVKDLHQDGVDHSWVRGTRGKAVKIISFLLRYLPQDNNYKIIFMRRDLGEVLASQNKMLERRGEQNDVTDEQMLALWKDHLWKVNYQLKRAPHMEFIEVVYSDAVNDPMKEVTRIRDFVGRDLNLNEMAAVVDSSLYRN